MTGVYGSMCGCVGYNSTAGSGVRVAGTAYYPPIWNCIFASNDQYGIECDATWFGLMSEMLLYASSFILQIITYPVA